MYKLYDEDNNYMRWVARKEEARAILDTHTDWTVRFVRMERKVVDLTTFEEAPF
jgi:hypothetical protein